MVNNLTVLFKTQEDAATVSTQLTERHHLIDSTIEFTQTIDREALKLAASLHGIKYTTQGANCLLPIPQQEWRSRECKDKDATTIYVADLASYTHGYLHGILIDCAKSVEEIQDDINFMLSWSPVRNISCCEEWAIHDYANWGDLSIGEWESLEKLSNMALGIAEHGDEYLAYLTQFNDDPSVEDFEDRYLGEYSTLAEYAEEFCENSGMLQGLDKSVAMYIDFKGMATDWELSGDISTVKTGSGWETSLYIFSNG